MRRKPLSPHSFSHSTYSKLFLILPPLLIAVIVVTAAAFVYYPIGIAANWVDSPVRFFNPNTPGVTVNLYDDDTAAIVDVTSPGVLERVRRSAFVWDDYSTNPFPGRLTTNTVTWSWNTAGFIAVTARSSAANWGGAHVAYYSTTPPAGTSFVNVLVKERHITGISGQYSGLITANSATLFNLMGYNRAGGASRFITIRRLSGATWSTLASVSLTLAENTWFIFLGRREYAGAVSFTVYNTAGVQQGSPISATDTPFTVNQVGVGVHRERGSITAHFDDFVACANANPRFVNVTGLEEGWTVYLYDETGSLVKQATAGPDGKASLDVLTRPIVRNARFEIRLGGTIILPSQSFSEVVGGDVYECSVKRIAILGFRNHDSRAFNVYLKVKSIQVPAGYSGSINLWVGAGATPIQIIGSSVIVDTTSETVLNPFGASYVYGTFSLCPTPPSQIVLTLSFHYYIPSSKVEVEYPVEVVVHG